MNNAASDAVPPGILLIGQIGMALFGKHPVIPPQTFHRFFAEPGHDYITRWYQPTATNGEAIWIEDYNIPGRVVSGYRPYGVMPLRDPFFKR